MRALGVAVLAAATLGITANQAFAGGDLWEIFAAGDAFVAGANEEVGQGASGIFHNTASEDHNVKADDNGPDGKPLFRSATFNSGEGEIKGVPFLTTGTYDFTCTLHPVEMTGTLTVNSTGTPLPRPKLNLTIKSKKLAKVAKRKTLKVKVAAGSSEAEGVVLEAKKGRKAISKPLELELGAGDSKRAKLKLKNRAAKKLAKLEKAKLKVTGTVDFGSPAKDSRKLK